MKMFWNHNSAYYPWIKTTVTDCKSILDVGCGEGSLVRFLDDGKKEITGIDIDASCIERAESADKSDKVKYICCDFEDYSSEKQFDAIIFVASIHHMDMASAVKKAKAMISPGGKLVIVGLSKPSTVLDLIIEVGRIIPSKIVSRKHKMESSEDINVPVSYVLPKMNEVRDIVREQLPGAKIRYGLHYRYLLEWEKE